MDSKHQIFPNEVNSRNRFCKRQKPASFCVAHSRRGPASLLSLLLLAAFVCSLFFPLPKQNTAALQASSPVSETGQPLPAVTETPAPRSYNFLNLALNADTAVIKEQRHGMRLYEKQPSIVRSLPLANHLMTAILALEYLDNDTIITLSQTAAALSDDKAALAAGGRYPVDYLLMAMLLNDSHAAALALAEEISGNEESFVSTMNNRASGMGLNSTLYTNATGLYDVNQHSSADDLITLLNFALRSDDFLRTFSTRDEMYFFPNGDRYYFTNDFASAWSFTDSTVLGGSLSSYEDRYTAALLIRDPVKDITYSVIMTGTFTESTFTNNRQLIADLQNISRSISTGYETSVLARRGETFMEDYPIAGQEVALVFADTVSYTHPLGDAYQDGTRLSMNTDQLSLPLTTDDVIGYVEFTLSEGTAIRVNLNPGTVILAQNHTVNYILSVINANQELVIFILILTGILALVLLSRLTRFIIRVVYRGWLQYQRKRGERRDAVNALQAAAEGRRTSISPGHRLISRSGQVPPRIAKEYRNEKNLPDPGDQKFVENP